MQDGNGGGGAPRPRRKFASFAELKNRQNVKRPAAHPRRRVTSGRSAATAANPAASSGSVLPPGLTKVAEGVSGSALSASGALLTSSDVRASVVAARSAVHLAAAAAANVPVGSVVVTPASAPAVERVSASVVPAVASVPIGSGLDRTAAVVAKATSMIAAADDVERAIAVQARGDSDEERIANVRSGDQINVAESVSIAPGGDGSANEVAPIVVSAGSNTEKVSSPLESTSDDATGTSRGATLASGLDKATAQDSQSNVEGELTGSARIGVSEVANLASSVANPLPLFSNLLGDSEATPSVGAVNSTGEFCGNASSSLLGTGAAKVSNPAIDASVLDEAEAEHIATYGVSLRGAPELAGAALPGFVPGRSLADTSQDVADHIPGQHGGGNDPVSGHVDAQGTARPATSSRTRRRSTTSKPVRSNASLQQSQGVVSKDTWSVAVCGSRKKITFADLARQKVAEDARNGIAVGRTGRRRYAGVKKSSAQAARVEKPGNPSTGDGVVGVAEAGASSLAGQVTNENPSSDGNVEGNTPMTPAGGNGIDQAGEGHGGDAGVANQSTGSDRVGASVTPSSSKGRGSVKGKRGSRKKDPDEALRKVNLGSILGKDLEDNIRNAEFYPRLSRSRELFEQQRLERLEKRKNKANGKQQGGTGEGTSACEAEPREGPAQTQQAPKRRRGRPPKSSTKTSSPTPKRRSGRKRKSRAGVEAVERCNASSCSDDPSSTKRRKDGDEGPVADGGTDGVNEQAKDSSGVVDADGAQNREGNTPGNEAPADAVGVEPVLDAEPSPVASHSVGGEEGSF